MPANNYSYIFFLPPPARNSAGISFFYDLAKDLRARGFDSWTTSDIKETFFLDDPYQRTITFSKALGIVRFTKVIAVYPETVSGNPLGSRRVVRIVANKPGHLGGDMEYRATERIFLFSRYFTKYILSPVCGYLYKPSLTKNDLEKFRETNKGHRKKKLFYQGKGKKIDSFVSSEYFEITRSSPLRHELPALFNEADHIIVFDNSTALTQEAALCGCVPIIIPDGSFSRDDLQNFELSDIGVAWGMDDVERARKSLPLLRGRVLQEIEGYETRLNDFINITQSGWRDFPDGVTSDQSLLLESVAYERELLWNFIQDRSKYWLPIEFECETNQRGASERVLIWGAGGGAIGAIRLVGMFSRVVAVTGKDNKIPAFLSDSGIAYVPPARVLDIEGEFDAIIVASVFRDQIADEIKETGLTNRKRVLFLSQGFLSNADNLSSVFKKL